MKVSKEQLKKLVTEAVRKQLNEMSDVEQRMGQIHILRMETGASNYELFEAMLEAMTEQEWKRVYSGLREIYGYRR